MKALLAAKLAVMEKVRRVEKTKRMVSASGGYQYAGVEEVIGELRPAMVAQGLCLAPVRSELAESSSYLLRSGTTMHRSIIKVTFRLSHASGEYEEIETYGEAADSGDKSCNKCHTAAMKYALLEAFMLQGAHDDPDDYPSQEQAPAKAQRSAKQASTPAKDAAPISSAELAKKIIAAAKAATTLADITTVENKMNAKVKATLTKADLDWVNTQLVRLKTAKMASKKDQKEAKQAAREPGAEN